jgi:hypothetical protein
MLAVEVRSQCHGSFDSDVVVFPTEIQQQGRRGSCGTVTAGDCAFHASGHPVRGYEGWW